MPLFNVGYGPALLEQNGPVVPVEIAVPSALEQQLKKLNQPVPPPHKGFALIDTGATLSAVDDSVIRGLGVSPVGVLNVGTPQGTGQQNVYPARFIFQVMKGFQIEFSRALGANFSGQPIHALIGRDVLKGMMLTYVGPQGQVYLSF